jgi:hypothetical protein
VRDLVQIHITADMPIRAQVAWFADRIELRFGSAFPVALVVDRQAVPILEAAIADSSAKLADSQQGGPRHMLNDDRPGGDG